MTRQTFTFFRLLGKILSAPFAWLDDQFDLRQNLRGVPHVARDRWRRWRDFTDFSFLRKCALVLLAAVVLLAGFRWWGLEIYRDWKVDRLLTQSVGQIEAENDRAAFLLLRQILVIRPDHPAANLRMAVLADKIRSPEAPHYWKRVAEIEPENLDHHLARYQSALQQRRMDEAAAALDFVPEPLRADSGYWWARRGLAHAARDSGAAETALRRILEIDPGDPRATVLLDLILFESGDPREADDARRRLGQLAPGHPERLTALRRIIRHHIERGEFGLAEVWAVELWNAPEATFEDRVAAWRGMGEAGAPDFWNYLEELQDEAGRGVAGMTVMLADFLIRYGKAEEAVRWLTELPEGLRETPDVQIVTAEALIRLEEWEELELQLIPRNWERLDYMRLAFLARSSRERGLGGSFRAEWSRATSAAALVQDGLRHLHWLVSRWGWEKEAGDLLELAIARAPSDSWLDQAAHVHAQFSGNSALALRLWKARHARDSTDFITAAAYARLALLMGEEIENARRLARRAWEKEPANPITRAAHGLSLLQQSQAEEAAALFPVDSGDDPGQSPFHAFHGGIILARAGNLETAERWLENIRERMVLLPEENALLEETVALINTRSEN